ncbi:hypothetical protein JCM11641_005694 [Rhodosporidiobolus odoratus]
MADYSAYAPPPPPRGPGEVGYNASIERGRSGYEGGLNKQMGQLNVQGGYQGYSQHPGFGRTSPYSPPVASSPSFPSSNNPHYNSSSPCAPPIPSASQNTTGGYSAANRPRPQLSPSTTGPTNGGGGFSGGSGLPPNPSVGLGPRQNSASTQPRVPRKSSLPPIPGAGAPESGFAHSTAEAPPLPSIPSYPTSSAHSSYAAAPSAHSSFPGGSAGPRDSSGGEAIFDGTALAAGDPQSQRNPPRKKVNQLEDLIATEQQYVQDLGAVIKRVAAAWSRANFPPPELDTMFRAVEAVYRINKTLLTKLLDIGPNPASPKALGDLLMRWILDVEPAYTRYAQTYKLDFDSFDPVQSNPQLAPILSSLPYPQSLPPPQSDEAPVTMDRLFELPVYRIKYYQKLYAKLLRSTQEGRSDYDLLIAANEKLARMDDLCEEGKGRSVLPQGSRGEGAGERERTEGVGLGGPPRLDVDLALANSPQGEVEVQERLSGDSTRDESPTSSSYRSSGATGASTANTSAAAGSSSRLPGSTDSPLAPIRVEELERRLNTDSTLDIFSMQPRKCKLQMQPASLPYQRQLRTAAPCLLSFYPSSDPSRLVSHPNAVLILLTDLFLVCGRVSAPAGGQDLALIYPPLTGKHLSAQWGREEGEIEITVMKKERLTVKLADGREAQELKQEIEEAVRFGMSQTAPRSNSAASGPPLSPTYSAYGARSGTPGGTSSNGHTSPLGASFPHPQLSLQTALGPSPSGLPSPSSHLASPISFSQQGLMRSTSPDGRSALSHGGACPSLRSHSSQQHLQQPSERRAFSGPAPSSSNLSIARPERNASMGNPPPASTNFPASSPGATSSRGPSPYSSGSEYYGQYQSPYGGRQSPYGQQQQYQQHDFAAPSTQSGAYPSYLGQPLSQGDFAPPSAPFAQGYDAGRSPSRSSSASAGSGGSHGSSSYPAPPPPLPKEMSYNGEDISGRGGPLFATNLQGGSGGHDTRSLSSSGRSGLLSPGGSVHRSQSADALRGDAQAQALGGTFHPHYRSPSQALLEDRSASAPSASSRSGSKLSHSLGAADDDDSPPPSPVQPKGPEQTRVVAEMRCKIFLQQYHSQWKSLGTAKLKLFLSQPSMTKQLVVDSDKKGQTIVSTIILPDGVERVGKTGVAIELSDKGDRTGIIYMLQMKTEQSATGLFEQLLLGSDRTGR